MPLPHPRIPPPRLNRSASSHSTGSKPTLGVLMFDFSCLRRHDDQLVTLAQQAEAYALSDAGASLMKLRLFGELLARKAGERRKLSRSDIETADAYLARLERKRVLPPTIARLFHDVRIAGNGAAHGEGATSELARTTLRKAHEIAQWFDAAHGGTKPISGRSGSVGGAMPEKRFSPNTKTKLAHSQQPRRASTISSARPTFALPAKRSPAFSPVTYLVGISVALVVVAVVVIVRWF